MGGLCGVYVAWPVCMYGLCSKRGHLSKPLPVAWPDAAMPFICFWRVCGLRGQCCLCGLRCLRGHFLNHTPVAWPDAGMLSMLCAGLCVACVVIF
jgi:hypothetical protein